jgi:predicted AAA+ superfamily ATPase
MKRDLSNDLIAWKTSPLRKPILLRGARQVGKSWLVRELGKSFDFFVEINFERDQKTSRLFDADLHVTAILEKLSLYCGQKIVTGKTLLFLDEIQECENALRALRYFKEDCPELHVIAAGSLIDFALEKLGIPVGRVQFFYLHPLSFGEFLTNSNREDLRQHIHAKKADPIFHETLLELLKTYMLLGGMPAVVDSWLNHKDISLCQMLQDEIITSYKQDFNKYARRHQLEHVTKIFESIPQHLGNKFKFSNIDEDIRAYPLKQAMLLLEKAGIALLCFHTSGQAQPLGAGKDEKKFKVFFFDIGLAQKLLGLNLSEWAVTPIKVSNVGALAEQLVAQEFVAYTSHHSPPELFYWHRENRGSNAEVDFLFLKNNMIIPVEVKSGIKGGLKSMKVFLAAHKNSKFGLKISEGNFNMTPEMEEIPLYGVEAWISDANR